MNQSPLKIDTTKLAHLQAETRRHRAQHGCDAYTFDDGDGLLAMAKAAGAVRMIELGTAIGYTACVLAAASPAAHVDTVEQDREHVTLARRNIYALGLAGRVTVHHGDFETVLRGLRPPYDLAFFDGLGPTLDVVQRLRDLLTPDGLLICSNLRWAASTAQLLAEFGRANRWIAAGSIESGRTLAFRKLDAGTA